MNKEQTIEKLKKDMISCGLDESVFDWEHEWDDSILPFENYTILKDKIRSLLPRDDVGIAKNLKSKSYEEEAKNSWEDYAKRILKDSDFNKDWVNNHKPIAIIGNANSGKTNLMFFLASLTKGNKYILGYPRKIEGFKQLNSTDDLKDIDEGTLCIDEFSKYFPVWDKRSNERLLDLLQFAEHNKIKLIITTQLSQFITKQCEALIPCWAIKQVNIRRLKNGSTPSYALKYSIKHPNISADFMKVDVNHFVWYNERGDIGENGIYSFPDMSIGKDWAINKNTDKNSDENITENTDKNISEVLK